MGLCVLSYIKFGSVVSQRKHGGKYAKWSLV